MLVCITQLSATHKLNCLMQHCTGKAANVIQSCALMDPSQGYSKARSLLQKRFGDDYVIAKAWINKITCGPPSQAKQWRGIERLC